MTEAPIEQIEFRWDHEYDLTGVASSFDSRTEFRQWNKRLTRYAGISGRGRTAASESPSSAVYLTYLDGTAALILRSVDPHAVPLDGGGHGPSRSAGADRLNMVARALIGPESVLTADIAMRVAATDPRNIFRHLPGQVGRGAPLTPLTFSHLSGGSSWEDLQRRGQDASGLASLLAAVLEDPARSLTVLLPEEEIRSPLRQSRALALLWATRRTLKALLTDADGRATDGWRAAFSTCEAPLGGGDGRTELAIAFRDRALDGPPVHEGPHVVRPDDGAGPQGDLSAAAGLLADAYRVFGDDCYRLVWPVVRGCGSLREKIEAVACSNEITKAIDPRPVAKVRRPARHGLESAVRRVPVQEAAAPSPTPVVPVPPPVPASTAQEPPVQQPPVQEPPVQERPLQEPPVQEPLVHEPAMEEPNVQQRPERRRGDPYLVRLYQMLGGTKDRAGSLRIMDWIAARTGRGGTLDAGGFSAVLQIMNENGWFADRVDGLADAPRRMADLMRPLFAVGHGEEELKDQLRRRHAAGGLPPVIADALGVLAGRLEPDRADWLAEHCLVYALPQLRPDPFGGGARHSAPGRESVARALLRLPGRKLPADVVGVLAWLSPVLLVVVVLLRMV
ncbi:hypothetical protein [Actinomadura chokoriensis]|uniref:Uncharacterized protein n=1 Tax=Actinomadura chokoriensis TaxID=454156 RepID=A0ABV4QYB3_9ACTN